MRSPTQIATTLCGLDRLHGQRVGDHEFSRVASVRWVALTCLSRRATGGAAPEIECSAELQDACTAAKRMTLAFTSAS